MASSGLRKMFSQYYFNPWWCMGKCMSSKYWTHILTYFIMAGVKPYNIGKCYVWILWQMFFATTFADCFVYCGIFWPTFIMADVIDNMLWLMLLPYMNGVADVMPLLITLVAIKLYEIGWCYCLAFVYVADVIALVADGITTYLF